MPYSRAMIINKLTYVASIILSLPNCVCYWVFTALMLYIYPFRGITWHRCCFFEQRNFMVCTGWSQKTDLWELTSHLSLCLYMHKTGPFHNLYVVNSENYVLEQTSFFASLFILQNWCCKKSYASSTVTITN